jgi:hypothetical protein
VLVDELKNQRGSEQLGDTCDAEAVRGFQRDRLVSSREAAGPEPRSAVGALDADDGAQSVIKVARLIDLLLQLNRKTRIE